MAKVKIYIVRHAESMPREGMAYDVAGKVPLSPKGRDQSLKLARSIKKLNIQKFFVSPLERTKETFNIINPGAPFEFDDRLKEHAPSRTMIGSDFKEARRRTRHEHDFVPKDGESFNQVAERFIGALNDMARSGNETVCIVSHALIIEAALTKLLNLPRIPKIDEASLSLVEYEERRFRLIYVNKSTSLVKNIKHFIKKIWKKN